MSENHGIGVGVDKAAGSCCGRPNLTLFLPFPPGQTIPVQLFLGTEKFEVSDEENM